MKKYLTIFAAIFLFTILALTPISAYTYESKISPQEFDKWIVESVLGTNYSDGISYTWLKNPDKNIKINRAVLKLLGGFIVEYIYWNENNTSFYEAHRFKYNIKNDCYEEIKEEIEEWMHTL